MTTVVSPKYTDEVEIDGIFYRWEAEGPSYSNGLAKFHVRRVNGPWGFTGGIAEDGSLYIMGGFNGLSGYLRTDDMGLLVALGRMTQHPDFRQLREAVVEGFRKANTR
jgi:hypothetical protein